MSFRFLDLAPVPTVVWIQWILPALPRLSPRFHAFSHLSARLGTRAPTDGLAHGRRRRGEDAEEGEVPWEIPLGLRRRVAPEVVAVLQLSILERTLGEGTITIHWYKAADTLSLSRQSSATWRSAPKRQVGGENAIKFESERAQTEQKHTTMTFVWFPDHVSWCIMIHESNSRHI